MRRHGQRRRPTAHANPNSKPSIASAQPAAAAVERWSIRCVSVFPGMHASKSERSPSLSACPSSLLQETTGGTVKTGSGPATRLPHDVDQHTTNATNITPGPEQDARSSSTTPANLKYVTEASMAIITGGVSPPSCGLLLHDDEHRIDLIPQPPHLVPQWGHVRLGALLRDKLLHHKQVVLHRLQLLLQGL
jgi:hypothetical protein